MWNKFVVSLFYEQLQDYNARFFAAGSTNNSIASYFLENANGLNLENISAFPGESTTDAYGSIGSSFGYRHQQAFLGYDSFILEPVSGDDDNTAYTSNIAQGNFNQEYDHLTQGYNGKFSFATKGVQTG